MQLKGRTAIVTGASRGIGEAIALMLAAEGVNLLLVARDAKTLAQVLQKVEKLGVQAEFFKADLSNVEEAKGVIDFVSEKFGKLDILVNNVGRSPKSNDPVEFDSNDWDKTLDVNFRSIYHLSKHALPLIQKNNEGAVVNISSIAATMTYKNGGIYCASKHALKAYTGCLFDNIRESGIKVCSILPGFVNTDMARSDELDEHLMIQPEDVAESVNFVLKSSKTVCPTEIKLRPQKSPYR